MTVWYAIPSARPAAEAQAVLEKWQQQGYRTAVFRDPLQPLSGVDLCLEQVYTGYANAVNRLALEILATDPQAEWIVTGGDDILPDPQHNPRAIAAECTAHFQGTFGIMQPTGDRFGEDHTGLCAAERVCISPWMGRDWCRRAYQGHGPLCHLFYHFFVDESLHCVAEKYHVLWHRPDLTQHHDWWGRRNPQAPRPKHLARAAENWGDAKQLFETRQAAGFPGSEPLP